jgi:hypothetical protein
MASLFDIRIISILLLIVTLWSCKHKEKVNEDEGILIASVLSKKLYLHDVSNMLPSGLSPEDSIIQLTSIAERWAQDQVMLNQAEKNISKDLDLDKLINDYKSSLVLMNYEKKLVENNMDTLVNENEIKSWASLYGKDFILQEKIIQCYYLRVSNEEPKLDKLRVWWQMSKPENKDSVLHFCSTHPVPFLLQDSVWLPLDDLYSVMPEELLEKSNLVKGRTTSWDDDEMIHFFKVIDLKEESEPSPVSYIKDEVRNMILRKRRQEFLHEAKQSHYSNYIKDNKVKIYTQ